MSKFVMGYSSAVTAAVSISVGLNLFLKRINNVNPSLKNLLQRFIPVPAVVTASTLNVILMRIHELDEGIEVTDSQGTVIGTSQIAAKNALKEMAISRAALGTSGSAQFDCLI